MTKQSELNDESGSRYSPAIIRPSATQSQEIYDSVSVSKEIKKSPLIQNSTFAQQKNAGVKGEERKQEVIKSNSCCTIS